jgi:hypothetical protein
VDDGTEGRARRDDGHGECTAFLEVMGEHSDAWDVHGP